MSSNSPRGRSGARSRKVTSAGRKKLDASPIGSGPSKRLRVAATAVPAAEARPRSALISILTDSPSCAASDSASSRVGTISPANSGANQLPASHRRIAARVCAETRPRPVVVRSSRPSWHSTSSPSPVSRTSNSTQAQPSSLARRSPASVFSGARAAAPRWPITQSRGTGARDGQAVSTPPPGRGSASERCLFLLRLFPLAVVAEILAGFLVDLAHAELDLAAVVEAENLDLDGVADLDDVGHLADALRRQFADMDEPVTRTEEVHEGAEIDGFDDLAIVDGADLGLGDDPPNPVDRRLRGVGVDRGNLDRAVIVDVDLRAGGLDDLADDLAARTDHLADLILGDRDRRDARRVFADLVACPGQRLGHLAEDVGAPVARLIERDPHDLLGDRGHLRIHLQRGDAVAGACHLEIHVAEMVLVPEDVGQDRKGVRFLDQTH